MLEQQTAQRDSLVERLNQSAMLTLEMFHIYLGGRLGLYKALAENGAMTSSMLASAAGINERYAREWLEQQAVSGVLQLEPGAEAPRFSLPAGHREVLVDRDSMSYLLPLGQGMVSIAAVMPQLIEAFRSGGGVPFEAYGLDMRESISSLNRPAFMNLLGTRWFPSIPDLHRRLQSDPPARVADVGCGTGWSCIAIAQAYPRVVVDGIDLSDASIEDARENAQNAGVADRVTFAVRDASDPHLTGQYDLVTAFETIHDMAHPVDALRAMRLMARPGAYVVVMDEKVPEEFSAPGDDLARFHYGWSAVHCLAAAMGEPGTAATGTIMRPNQLREYARAAGFSDIEILPVEHDSWSFYRLLV